MDGEKDRAHGARYRVEIEASRKVHYKRVGKGHHTGMAFFSKSKPLVGLDIGSSSVKAVELTKSKKGYQITGFASESLGPDAVVDGAIMDSPAVADAIKRTLATGKFNPKGVAAGVSGHSVIVKRVVLPVATEQEVDASIQFDAEQYIPFGLSEVNMD